MTRSISKEFRTTKGAVSALSSGERSILYRGDCEHLLDELPENSVDLVITSPPYCIGMEYEHETSVDEFIARHKRILPKIIRVVKEGGSICWQVGYHVTKKVSYPLDFAVFAVMQEQKDVFLRNRIIWSFSHGLHGRARFSGRHETILWFTKGREYQFNLDAMRIPQKYPGKKHYKGERKGEYSGNPNGKNPGDVWDIPNVKGNHVEKVGHPCQFPVALVQRLVRGLSPTHGVVFDPYAGSASAGVAALLEERRFLGAEINEAYCRAALERLKATLRQEVRYRPLDRPIFKPSPRSSVARRPKHFKDAAE